VTDADNLLLLLVLIICMQEMLQKTVFESTADKMFYWHKSAFVMHH